MNVFSKEDFWDYFADLRSSLLRNKQFFHAEDDLTLEDIEFSGPTNEWCPDDYPDVIDSEKPVRKNWSPYK